MSARVVAVTRLLLDVLEDLADSSRVDPGSAEAALRDLLDCHHLALRAINHAAVQEMNQLAAGVLAQDTTPEMAAG